MTIIPFSRSIINNKLLNKRMSFAFQKQSIISIEAKQSLQTASSCNFALQKRTKSEEDIKAMAVSAFKIPKETENYSSEFMDPGNKKIVKLKPPTYTEIKKTYISLCWYEKIERELSSEFAIRSKKKSVVEFRLRARPIINKTFRKRLIGKTYITWLRPSVKHTSVKKTSEVDNLMERKLTEKLLFYGKFKATPDKRPSQCPLKFIQIVNHVDSGARIFPNPNISPNKQKKCVCEFFSIKKSPLFHQN